MRDETTEHPSLFGAQQGLSGETQDDHTSHPEKPSPAEHWQEAMNLWTTLAKESGKRGTPYQRRAPTGQSLAARLDEHGPDTVAQVLRWYWRSTHDRAAYLRAGEYGLTTLMRPDHFVRYLAMSDSDADACRREPKAAVPRPSMLARRRPRASTAVEGGEE